MKGTRTRVVWIVRMLAVLLTERTMADETRVPARHSGHLTVDQYPPPAPRTLPSGHLAKIHRASMAGTFWLGSSPLGNDESAERIAGNGRMSMSSASRKNVPRIGVLRVAEDGPRGRSIDRRVPEALFENLVGSNAEGGPSDRSAGSSQFVDEGPGSVETYTLNLLENGLQLPNRPEENGGELQEERWPPPKKVAFGNGRVPELQTGCEGLEKYAVDDGTGGGGIGDPRPKRSGDTARLPSPSSNYSVRILPVGEDGSNGSNGSDGGDGADEDDEEPDELLRLKKLFRMMQGPRRGDMQIALDPYSSLSVDDLPKRGDLGEVSATNGEPISPRAQPVHGGGGHRRSPRSVLWGFGEEDGALTSGEEIRGASLHAARSHGQSRRSGNASEGERARLGVRRKFGDRRNENVGQLRRGSEGKRRRGADARQRIYRSFVGRESPDNAGTRRTNEKRRQTQEEEEKLRDYVRRNQPMTIPSRPNYQPSERNSLEYGGNSRYPSFAGDGTEHGSSAGEGVRAAERRRQEYEHLRKEALRREEEYRRQQSRRYEEDRRRQEVARFGEERRTGSHGTQEPWNAAGSPGRGTEAVGAAGRVHAHGRQHDQQREREGRRGAGGDTALSWRRREEEEEEGETARLNALPVSARIVLEPRRHTSETSVSSRFGSNGGAGAGSPSPSPSPCVWAIVQCCPLSNYRLVTCFESMGCPGANWTPNPCSRALAHAARTELINFYARDDARRHL